MEDLDKVKLLDIDADNSVMWVGTWKKFVDDNIDAGMEREEIDKVAGSLDRGEMHLFGGGSGDWELVIGADMAIQTSGSKMEEFHCYDCGLNYSTDEAISKHTCGVTEEGKGNKKGS